MSEKFPMHTLYARSDDGTKLRLGRWNEEGKKDILLVHGLAEHLGRYPHVAQFFAEKGWRVTMVELRGHGESEGARGHTPSWMQYCEDLQTAMTTVGRPMSIIAHSMGGLVTLWSMQHPLTPTVNNVVFSNPLWGLFTPPPQIKVILGKVASRIAPSVRLPNDLDPNHTSRDTDVVEKYKKDPLIFNTITARWAKCMLEAIDCVHQYAPKYKHNALLLLGNQDKICSPDSAKQLAKTYGTQNNGHMDLREYVPCYHELFNEPEKYDILEDVHTWLEKQ